MVYSVSPNLPFLSLLPPTDGVNWELKTFTTDLDAEGYYDITISAALVNYPEVAAGTYSFRMELINSCKVTKFKAALIDKMEYTIGEPATTQMFKQFEDSEAIY